FCHEFGHVLGLPDLYDTDYENNGQADDMGYYSLMASGSYNNSGRTPPYLTCMEKSILGWMGEPEEWTASGHKTVAGIQNNVSFFTKTSTDGEIFIYETRTGTGWDSYVEPGLAIYHLDRSDRTVVGSSTAKDLWNQGHGQEINAIGSHPCYYIVKASSYYFTFGGRSGNTEFSSTSNPGSIDWDGKATGYDITDIKFADGVTTLTLNIDNDRKIVGTVKGGNGLALQNVSISIVPKSAAAQAISTGDGKRTLGILDSEALKKVAKYRTVTDKDGKYKIVLDDAEGTSYYIVASKEGYISQSKEIGSVAGTAVADFKMSPQFITDKSDLQKYDGIGYSRVGYGEAPSSMMGAVGFTEDELLNHVGDKLTSISFLFDGSHADNVYVVVDVDDERVLTKKLDTVVYGGMNTVDISNENIIIPAGHDMFIGYALENVDSGYPLVTGSNSYVDGGMYYSTFNLKSTGWRVWEGNIIVSATAEPQRKDFTDMGFNLIKNDKSRWTAGEEFVFALVDSSVKPESVVWYYDEKQTSEAKVRLTSGSHSIVAIITNYDGSTEELELILDVD
ncbi:MAG: immune inhibitor A, partial [Bacteroidales bacterium]|nr:immune inhibitor A [Candidatus Cryptobacteroides caccocaballi]